MTDLKLPKVYNFGDNELVELKHLETTFEISRKLAYKYLRALHIQPLYFKNEVFFSISSFNRIMFVLTRPGSKGFLFPGSTGKNNANLRKSGNFLIEVDNTILKEASSPQVLAEMLAASGRNVSMIGKLISSSNANPKSKEKK